MTIEYASPMTPGVAERRIGFLSLCASIAFPGFGQLLAHRPLRAVIWFLVYVLLNVANLVCLCIPPMVPALLAVIPLTFLIQFWMWIDAFICGHRYESPKLGHPFIKFPLAFVLLCATPLLIELRLLPSFYVKSHWAEAFILHTTSGMQPTLVPRDCMLVHKHMQPQRWNIIAFTSPEDGTTYMKRLVGLPGEKIEIVGGVVHVNGQPQSPPLAISPYLSIDPRTSKPIRSPAGPTGCEGDPVMLGPDEFYVLGDNSPTSLDSRYFQKSFPGHQRGTISRASIIGVATWIYWPPRHWRKLN